MTDMGARTRMNQEENQNTMYMLKIIRKQGIRGVKILKELPEGEIKRNITRGLAEGKMEWTDETWEEDMKNLKEMLETKEREAKREERRKEREAEKGRWEQLEAEMRELRKRIEALEANKRKEEIRDRQKGTRCYNCQRYGHIAMYCRMRNNENSQNNKNGSSYICSTLTPKESKHWSPDVDREISGSESEYGWTAVQTNREIRVRVERKRVYDNNRP
ncbi:hypothetical protein NEOKW01_0261 [Nematocida sp. AWRm80]|nr:hypothetical protein NEOKW01_0261 [Nematocida sp. AWRm80]